MATKTILVCDKCESQEDVMTVELRLDGKKAKLDLCATHRMPVEDLFASSLAGRTAPRKQSPRPIPRAKVTTMDEIEKLKKKP